MTSECEYCCCCDCCLQCCNKDNKKGKYARIEYDDPDEQEVSSTGMSLVPLERIFQTPQQRERYTNQPHSLTASNSLQEMHLLSTSEDSVVKDQPKAMKYNYTKSDQFKRPHQRRVTIGSSDELRQAATLVTESANKETKHLLWRSRLEVFSSQLAQVPQLPVLVEEGDEQLYPFLQFSLHYDIQRRTMTVHLQEASNLPAKDRSGTSDPFVVMHLHPNKEEIFKSQIVYKTLNPVFDQSFEFHNLQLDDIHRQSLVFRIYDHDKFFKNDIIGGIVLPLRDADVYGVVYKMRVDERVEKFKSNESKGDLYISLAYHPKQCVVEGVILKVTNLVKQDISGLADPYVKVYLVYQGKQIAKWKTSVKRNTLIAVFNEPFQFDLEKKDINSVGLEVAVMDYDRFGRNDYIGTVQFGASVDHHSGSSHWTDVISTPKQRISRWHSIKRVSSHTEATKKKIIHQPRKASAPF